LNSFGAEYFVLQGGGPDVILFQIMRFRSYGECGNLFPEYPFSQIQLNMPVRKLSAIYIY